MLVSDRTHPLDQDLDWVPARLKRWRWLARSRPHGATPDPPVWLLPLALVPVLGDIALLYFFSTEDRSATYDDPWLRDHLSKLGARERTLATLDGAAEGERVLVRGRVACEVPLLGVLDPSPGVCRRLAFKAASKWWIHEASVDFQLVGAEGESVYVHAAGARFVSRIGEPAAWPAHRLVGDGAPHGVRARYDAARTKDVRAAERVLQVGEAVTVIAHRTSIVDPAGVNSGYRDPPRRAALTGSTDVPLLIVREIEL